MRNSNIFQRKLGQTFIIYSEYWERNSTVHECDKWRVVKCGWTVVILTHFSSASQHDSSPDISTRKKWVWTTRIPSKDTSRQFTYCQKRQIIFEFIQIIFWISHTNNFDHNTASDFLLLPFLNLLRIIPIKCTFTILILNLFSKHFIRLFHLKCFYLTSLQQKLADALAKTITITSKDK